MNEFVKALSTEEYIIKLLNNRNSHPAYPFHPKPARKTGRQAIPKRTDSFPFIPKRRIPGEEPGKALLTQIIKEINTMNKQEPKREPERPKPEPQPEKPGQPGRPDQPDKPLPPERPDKPYQPDQPTKPDQPMHPNKPDQPNQPVAELSF